MIIEKIYAENSLRNFNYVLSCPHTHKAIVIDPLATEEIKNHLKTKELDLEFIINTHEHHDHISGNKELQEYTGAKIIGFHGLKDKIPGLTDVFSDKESIFIGDEKLKVLHTPGHTQNHSCLYYEKEPALFCGDTLFYAGVGNCKHGGNVQKLFETIEMLRKEIPDNAMIYPGHDYLEKNLEFARKYNPANKKLEQFNEAALTTTKYFHNFLTEKKINPFLQLQSEALKKSLRLQGASDSDVFFKLRKLRDQF